MITAPTHTTYGMSKLAPGFYGIEASMLQMGGQRPLFGRVYAGRDVQGFFFKSTNTGDVIRVVVATEHRDQENDVTHWTCNPDRDDCRLLNVEPFVLTVWND